MELPDIRSPRPGQRGLVAGPRGRLPRRSGPQITERDVSILEWIGRHGVVTPLQVAGRFFLRDGGRIGQWAAYRRLRNLEQLGLLRHDRTFWRETSVLRLTASGARLSAIDVSPARLVLAELRHSLAVVDLVEMLLLNSPPGTVVRTERELRAQRRRDLRAGTRRPGQGRIPDALFVHPAGATAAIELDVTPKRTPQLESILRAYRQERYARVVWYVLPNQHARLKAIVAKENADDFIDVRVWYGQQAGRTA